MIAAFVFLVTLVIAVFVAELIHEERTPDPQHPAPERTAR